MNHRTNLALMIGVAVWMGCGGGGFNLRISSSRPVGEKPAPVETVPVEAPVDTERIARELWSQAAVSKAAGDAVDVRRVLTRLVRAAPETLHGVDARVQLADDALARRAWPAALEWVESLSSTGSVGYDRFRVLALAYEGQTQYAEAAEAWLEASKQAQDDATRRTAVEGAAQDLYLGGKLEDARRVAGSLGDASDGLRERVAPRLAPVVLQALAETVPLDDPDHAWLILRHAQAECAAGKLSTCTASAEVASKSTDATIAGEAGRLLERVKAWNQVRPTRLGILLPQSGRFRELGEDAFESIQQAIKGESNIELVVRDTAGKAGLAAQGAEELILQEHVAAIVGPIGEIESRAAVMSSARFGVPHVVFSSKPGVGKSVPTALRMRLSPEEVVEALARYAVTELRVKRAAFLVPEQKGRRRQMMAFWDEFVRLGGEVRAVEFYKPDQKDFKPIMRKLIAATKPGTGVVDFDTLFIPDDALHVHHLVPFLKYFGMRMKTHPKLRTTKRTQPIQLLGVASWNSSAVIDPEGLTENAVFMNSFFHAPDNRIVDRFVRRFHKRYRRKPNAFQAEVYDTVKLVASAMKGIEGTDQTAREALMTAILGVKHHSGVTGHITILDDGTMVLKPRVLTIHLDDIRLRMSEEEEAHLRGGTGRRR